MKKILLAKLGNHDKSRFGTRYGTERVDGLLTLLLTLPGVAITYNGDEIGMLDHAGILWEETQDPQACNTNDPINFVHASRDPARTPYQWDASAFAGFKEAGGKDPWIPVNPNYPTLNLAEQKTATKSFFKLYQQLAQLRDDEVFVKGSFETHAFNDEVFAYKRSIGEKSYVVLINFKGNEHTLNVNDLKANFPEQVEVVLAGSKSSYAVG